MANVLGSVKVGSGHKPPRNTKFELDGTLRDGFVQLSMQLPGQKKMRDFGFLPIVGTEVTVPVPLVFLCHAKVDKAVVDDVADRLLQQGVLTWYDENDLLPGDFWERKIEEAIESTDYVLAFLSKRSVAEEGYVQREFRLALKTQERKPLGQRFIVPLLVEDFVPPREFRDVQWVKWWEPTAADKLARAFSALPNG